MLAAILAERKNRDQEWCFLPGAVEAGIAVAGSIVLLISVWVIVYIPKSVILPYSLLPARPSNKYLERWQNDNSMKKNAFDVFGTQR